MHVCMVFTQNLHTIFIVALFIKASKWKITQTLNKKVTIPQIEYCYPMIRNEVLMRAALWDAQQGSVAALTSSLLYPGHFFALSLYISQEQLGCSAVTHILHVIHQQPSHLTQTGSPNNPSLQLSLKPSPFYPLTLLSGARASGPQVTMGCTTMTDVFGHTQEFSLSCLTTSIGLVSGPWCKPD